jgi:murein tripeptide amidase MpaA
MPRITRDRIEKLEQFLGKPKDQGPFIIIACKNPDYYQYVGKRVYRKPDEGNEEFKKRAIHELLDDKDGWTSCRVLSAGMT